MTATPQQARKEIFTRINDCWQARAGIIVGGPVPEARWQGEEKPGKPDKDKYWIRSSTQLVTTRQAGHREPPAPGQSLAFFDTFGVVFVQVFAPMKTGAYAKGELLGELLQNAFMATETPSGVWFRNPRINELENDGTWYRWNVIADFQFNQVRGA